MYYLYIYKNGIKHKYLTKFERRSEAKEYMYDLHKKSMDILFPVHIVHTERVEYELILVCDTCKVQKSLFKTDILGRQRQLTFSDGILIDVKPYNYEELIFDTKDKKRYSVHEIIKKYYTTKKFMLIYNINTRVIFEIDDDELYLFTVKDKYDARRLIDILEDYFMTNGMINALFSKDTDRYFKSEKIKMLTEKHGYNKWYLNLLRTTHIKRVKNDDSIF